MAFSSDQPLLSNQLPISIDFPEEKKLFLNTITETYKRIANAVNTKEGALYQPRELATFKLYFKYLDPSTFSQDITKFRNGYRTTFDLVSLNGGVAIPTGLTSLVLSASTTPPLINGILVPILGYGSATITGPKYVFFPNATIDIQFDNTTPAAQTITINNTSGSVLTQAYFVLEYLKES